MIVLKQLAGLGPGPGGTPFVLKVNGPAHFAYDALDGFRLELDKRIAQGANPIFDESRR